MINPAPDARAFDARPEQRALRAWAVTLSMRLPGEKDQENDPEYRKFRVKVRVKVRLSSGSGEPLLLRLCSNWLRELL